MRGDGFSGITAVWIFGASLGVLMIIFIFVVPMVCRDLGKILCSARSNLSKSSQTIRSVSQNGDHDV